MTDSSIIRPTSKRLNSASDVKTKTKFVPQLPVKGRILAVVAFAAVYVATLVVLFAPKAMIQNTPQAFAAPVMSKTVTMPIALPAIAAPLASAP